MTRSAYIFADSASADLVAKAQMDVLKNGYVAATVIKAEPSALYDAIFAQPAEMVLYLGNDPQTLCALAALRATIVWDMAGVTAEMVEGWLSDSKTRVYAMRAIARSDAMVNLADDVRKSFEEKLHLGTSAMTFADAARYLERRVLIVLGAGLGNMLNASPMIRWVSEHIGGKVDLVVNNDFNQAIELFAEAPYINRVHPGFEYLVGKHYDVQITTTFAAHVEPTCTADISIQQHKLYNYNRHGRFIRDADTAFLGLERAFADVPQPGEDIPLPFVRDTQYFHPNDKVIGIANGVKEGTWAKRQWPFITQLAQRLMAEGYELRTFGLKEELVEGTVDKTELSIRDTIAEMAQCSYFIGHDGGMCHLADAIGVPSLWFFGPTAYYKNGPMQEPSIVLTSDPACGPCNYKTDWIRCAEPTCMSDITVEHALSGFADLRAWVERDGATPRLRRWDPALIEKEINAVDLPPRPGLESRSNAERVAALPIDATQHLAICMSLIREGDFDGFQSLVAQSTRLFPANAALTAVAIFAEDLRASEGTQLRELPSLGQAWIAASALKMPTDLRTFGEVWMSCLIRRRDNVGLAGFAETVMNQTLSDGHMSRVTKWAEKLWMKILANYSPADFVKQRAAIAAIATGNDQITAMLKGAVDAKYVVSEIKAAVENLARENEEAPETAQSFAPSIAAMRSISTAAGQPLPGYDNPAPPWSAVVLVAEMGEVNKAPIGSFTSAVTWLARAMAFSGLRPFVVNMSVGIGRPLTAFRDNVTYINASPTWTADVWKKVWETVAPVAVYDFHGAAANGGLAKTLPVALVSVGPHGFYRGDVLNPNLFDEVTWDPQPGAGKGDISFDSLSSAFVPRLRPASGLQNRSGVGVLINNLADLPEFVRLSRRLPHIHFHVVADGFHRGIEPNVSYTRRANADLENLFERREAFLQFATAPTDITIESLRALAAGVPVVTTGRNWLAGQKLVEVQAPYSAADWGTAITALLQALQDGPATAIQNAAE